MPARTPSKKATSTGAKSRAGGAKRGRTAPGSRSASASTNHKDSAKASSRKPPLDAVSEEFKPVALQSRAIEGTDSVKHILSVASPKVRELAETLRRLVKKAAPDARERGEAPGDVISFEKKKAFCFISPKAEHVVLGFHRGADLDDPESLLGSGRSSSREIKVAAVHDIRGGAFERFVRQARDLASK